MTVVLHPNFDLGPAKEAILYAKQRTVGDVLKKQAFLIGDKTALIWKEQSWTFRQLNEEVNVLANGLLALGVKRGDRISVLTKNRAECCHILYAASKIGAIVAFLNWRYTEVELVEAISVVTSKVMIYGEEFSDCVNGIKYKLNSIELFIQMDTSDEAVIQHTFEDIMKLGSADEPYIALHEEDALFIVYTSGTTGTPKGAVISQRSEMQRIFAFLSTFTRLLKVDEEDLCVARGPFFHVAVIDNMFGTHALGGRVQILEGFNPREMCDLIENEKLGWLAMSPGMFSKMLDEINSRDLKPKGIKAIGSMADLVSNEIIAELTTKLQAPYFNTYGLTEIGMHNFSQNVLPIASKGVEYKSMGKAEGIFPEVRLVDNYGNDADKGDIGELWIRTPMMFSGYWNNPEENSKVFNDGWFKTGDILRRNWDGTVDFVSRTKYMIKSGGENIYPAEIERVLLKHESVREAIVIGAAHEKWGETPVAYIAVDKEIEEEEIKTFLRQYLAGYRIPSAIHIIDFDDFPRNTNGKILREQVESWSTKQMTK